MIKRHADDVTIDYIIRLRKLEQENERLREALRFYANPLNYEQDMDAGEKARAALKENE